MQRAGTAGQFVFLAKAKIFFRTVKPLTLREREAGQ